MRGLPGHHSGIPDLSLAHILELVIKWYFATLEICGHRPLPSPVPCPAGLSSSAPFLLPCMFVFPSLCFPPLRDHLCLLAVFPDNPFSQLACCFPDSPCLFLSPSHLCSPFLSWLWLRESGVPAHWVSQYFFLLRVEGRGRTGVRNVP